jgi:tight adherence protein B
MIPVCLACVVLTVLLALPPAPTRHLGKRLAETTTAAARRPGRYLGRMLLGLGAVVAALWSAGASSGSAGVVVACAALVGIATVVRLLGQHRRSRAVIEARVAVAHACAVLAAHVRVGRVPAEALASAAQDCPVMVEAHSINAVGGDVTTAWRLQACRPGYAGLRDLARAWQVSAETGAPLATALDQVSDALTADQALRTVVAGELAAPRATGKIMAALPFCGLSLGYLIGGDPLSFLLAGPPGWVCLIGGVALAAAGVLWIDLLAQRATEQG